MNFQSTKGICIPKMQETRGKNNKTQAYSTPGPGPRQARAGAWVPGPNWGCYKLAFYCSFNGFLACALIGLEINIRLDLISNVCIIIPGVSLPLPQAVYIINICLPLTICLVFAYRLPHYVYIFCGRLPKAASSVDAGSPNAPCIIPGHSLFYTFPSGYLLIRLNLNPT